MRTHAFKIGGGQAVQIDEGRNECHVLENHTLERRLDEVAREPDPIARLQGLRARLRRVIVVLLADVFRQLDKGIQVVAHRRGDRQVAGRLDPGGVLGPERDIAAGYNRAGRREVDQLPIRAGVVLAAQIDADGAVDQHPSAARVVLRGQIDRVQHVTGVQNIRTLVFVDLAGSAATDIVVQLDPFPRPQLVGLGPAREVKGSLDDLVRADILVDFARRAAADVGVEANTIAVTQLVYRLRRRVAERLEVDVSLREAADPIAGQDAAGRHAVGAVLELLERFALVLGFGRRDGGIDQDTVVPGIRDDLVADLGVQQRC